MLFCHPSQTANISKIIPFNNSLYAKDTIDALIIIFFLTCISSLTLLNQMTFKVYITSPKRTAPALIKDGKEWSLKEAVSFTLPWETL
jgi:hypothetical protein